MSGKVTLRKQPTPLCTMKISMYLFGKGSLNTDHPRAQSGMTEKLGPLTKVELDLPADADRISHPEAVLRPETTESGHLDVICSYYIPAYIAAGGITLVISLARFQVWNGRPTDICVDERKDQAVREGSRAQLFFEIEDLTPEQHARIVRTIREGMKEPRRQGNVSLFFCRKGN